MHQLIMSRQRWETMLCQARGRNQDDIESAIGNTLSLQAHSLFAFATNMLIVQFNWSSSLCCQCVLHLFSVGANLLTTLDNAALATVNCSGPTPSPQSSLS